MNKILVALLVALAVAQFGDAKPKPALCRKMFLSQVRACTDDWVACSATDINDDVDVTAEDLEEVDETACDVKAVNACVVDAVALLNKKFGDSTKNPGCAAVVNMYREALGKIPM